MPKKKVLVFIDWFTPGYKAGGPIESCANLVDHLKDDIEFSVVTRDTDYCESIPYPGVKSNSWNNINGIRVFYFSKEALTKKNISQLLLKEEYDSIYLNGIFSLRFTLIPLYLLRGTHKRVIVASRGMFAPSALQVKKIKKYFFLLAAKITGLFDNVIFHATNENEKTDIISKMGFENKIIVAPNLPKKKIPRSCPVRIKSSGTLKLINIARISPEKNLKYALEILKTISGNVEFDFYGPVYDQDYWTECKEIISQLPSNIKATYKDSIEKEKVSEALSNAHIMFMPTRGENFGHIILQSLSNGCPVIISDQTIWRSLENKKAGWDLSLNNPGDFSKVISNCINMYQEEYSTWSQQAYQLAISFVNDKSLLETNRKLFA